MRYEVTPTCQPGTSSFLRFRSHTRTDGSKEGDRLGPKLVGPKRASRFAWWTGEVDRWIASSSITRKRGFSGSSKQAEFNSRHADHRLRRNRDSAQGQDQARDHRSQTKPLVRLVISLSTFERVCRVAFCRSDGCSCLPCCSVQVPRRSKVQLQVQVQVHDTGTSTGTMYLGID